MSKLIDKLEISFKDRPLSTMIVGTPIGIGVVELFKFLFSLITKTSLKPLSIWLFEKSITLKCGWFVLIIIASLLIPFVLSRISRRKTNSIIFNNKPESQSFKFTKQQIDDHFYIEELRLDEYYYEISLTPSFKTDYWRAGIKLSHVESFKNDRLTKGNPLFHLTKNLDQTWLGVTYYDENNVLWQEVDRHIIDDYQKETIKIKIFNTSINTVIVIIDGSQNVELYVHEIQKYGYAKLFAWGDKNDFEIDCEMKKRKRE